MIFLLVGFNFNGFITAFLLILLIYGNAYNDLGNYQTNDSYGRDDNDRGEDRTDTLKTLAVR